LFVIYTIILSESYPCSPCFFHSRIYARPGWPPGDPPPGNPASGQACSRRKPLLAQPLLAGSADHQIGIDTAGGVEKMPERGFIYPFWIHLAPTYGAYQ
jgi:hypothetical protein